MAKTIAITGAGFTGAGRKVQKSDSLFERGANWFNVWRATRNDRRIERYINEHGGVLTDSLEREISQKFVNTDPGRF